jgi:hypothetical protein
MILTFTLRTCKFLATNLYARNQSLAKFIALVVFPVSFATLKPILRLGATRSATIRDASLSLRVSLDIVGFAVTLSVNLNRARLHSTLILGTLEICSLFNLIVLATHPLKSGIRWATNH